MLSTYVLLPLIASTMAYPVGPEHSYLKERSGDPATVNTETTPASDSTIDPAAKVILGFNEPDLPSQSNLDPASVAKRSQSNLDYLHQVFNGWVRAPVEGRSLGFNEPDQPGQSNLDPAPLGFNEPELPSQSDSDSIGFNEPDLPSQSNLDTASAAKRSLGFNEPDQPGQSNLDPSSPYWVRASVSRRSFGFNEPNEPSQSNLDPASVAKRWLEFDLSKLGLESVGSK